MNPTASGVMALLLVSFSLFPLLFFREGTPYSRYFSVIPTPLFVTTSLMLNGQCYPLDQLSQWHMKKLCLLGLSTPLYQPLARYVSTLIADTLPLPVHLYFSRLNSSSFLCRCSWTNKLRFQMIIISFLFLHPLFHYMFYRNLGIHLRWALSSQLSWPTVVGLRPDRSGKGRLQIKSLILT